MQMDATNITESAITGVTPRPYDKRQLRRLNSAIKQYNSEEKAALTSLGQLQDFKDVLQRVHSDLRRIVKVDYRETGGTKCEPFRRQDKRRFWPEGCQCLLN
jgi:hypothetical protein